jgi:hypothetical protein
MDKDLGEIKAAPHQEPLGWVELDAPISLDVKALCRMMSGQNLVIADGSEYILDTSDTTILLFGSKTGDSFTKIYSPMNGSALKAALAVLPDDERKQIESAFGIENIQVQATSKIATQPLDQLMLVVEKTPFADPLRNAANLEGSPTTPRTRQPESLPEDHFLELDEAAFERKKAEQWAAVEGLDDNDPRKILYFRRFFSEYKSPVHFDPRLTEQSETNFRYYAVNTSKKAELPDLAPYKTELEIPAGVKIGIVIGYHHLEKPWGYLFKRMFLDQVSFPPEQIEFIEIQNRNIPTGAHSPQSEAEIQAAVAQSGLTHAIDAHEQLATGNNYMDLHSEDPKFKASGAKNPSGQEYTLDPFIPLWAIEQYYEGNTYPTLQHAMNEQIRVVEKLAQSLAA